MDLLTHALMGAQAARLGADESTRLGARERLLLGAGAAAFPDLDFVGFLVDPLRFLAHWHQGPTHSLLLLPLWALLLGALFSAATRRRQVLGEAVLVCALGLATHLALDLITAYGTQLWYPLSERRFSLGLAFVIDPFLTVVVGIGLWLSLRAGRRRLAGVLAGVLLLGVYLGALALLKGLALRLADDAIPQPFSPFNWKLVRVQGSQREVAHVNLAGHAPLLPRGLGRAGASAAAYVPPGRIEWQRRQLFGADALVQSLWERADFADFRLFAVHPALSRIDAGAASTCVWFTDLRYDLPAWPDTFRYGHCRESPGSEWRLHRLRYFSEDGRQAID